jgi:hypothetical protein
MVVVLLTYSVPAQCHDMSLPPQVLFGHTVRCIIDMPGERRINSGEQTTTQETYLWSELERRRPGMGYRG